VTVICSKPATLPPAVAEQYELLRAAMLGAALPPDTRAGLFVFLHRGMLAWARTILLDAARMQTIAASSVRPSDLDRPDERRAVVQLLAAMAMTITDRSPA
jgi:hypothetical protein